MYQLIQPQTEAKPKPDLWQTHHDARNVQSDDVQPKQVQGKKKKGKGKALKPR